MDGCSGKRAVDGLVVPKRRSGLVSGENMNNRYKNGQICSRIGCSARIGSLDKSKSTKPSIRSSLNGKAIVGSSRSFSGVGNARRSSANSSRQLPSLLETDSSETSSVHDEPEASEPIPPPGKTKRGLNTRSEYIDSTVAGSPSLASSTRGPRSSYRRSGLASRETVVGPGVSLSSRNSSQAECRNLSRNSLRNLTHSSVSGVASFGSSSSDSSLSRKKDVFKKRNSDGESSSFTRGKKMIVSKPPVDVRNQNSTHGVSVSDARRNRQSPANRDDSIDSVSVRRPTSYSRTRRSDQGKGNSVSVPQPEIPVNLNPPLSGEIFVSPPISYSRSDSGNGRVRSTISSSPATTSLMNRDSLRGYNVDGIAEVLLALERIEQDEELTYERLFVLETNLFLSGLNFYDQHRDMRLDIDNMSYEELLALEERMGTVSTGVSEESLSKCLKTSIYQSILLEDETGGSCLNKDEVKCSICQEEYVEGEEVGRLRCEHGYHVGCIQQWLRMKNWCPICKASAEPSPPESHPSS